MMFSSFSCRGSFIYSQIINLRILWFGCLWDSKNTFLLIRFKFLEDTMYQIFTKIFYLRSGRMLLVWNFYSHFLTNSFHRYKLMVECEWRLYSVATKGNIVIRNFSCIFSISNCMNAYLSYILHPTIYTSGAQKSGTHNYVVGVRQPNNKPAAQLWSSSISSRLIINIIL